MAQSISATPSSPASSVAEGSRLTIFMTPSPFRPYALSARVPPAKAPGSALRRSPVPPGKPRRASRDFREGLQTAPKQDAERTGSRSGRVVPWTPHEEVLHAIAIPILYTDHGCACFISRGHAEDAGLG